MERIAASCSDTPADVPQPDLKPGSKWDYAAPIEFKRRLPELQRTNLGWSLALVVKQHSIIILLAVTCILAFHRLPWWVWIPTHCLALIGIAHCMRALELLVHDGAHFNWNRRKKGLNDALTNLLAAFPVAAEVTQYRHYHDIHHRHLGTTDDPERRRYHELGMDGFPRGGSMRFWRQAAPVFARYLCGEWWVVAKSARRLGSGLLWHVVVLLVPLSLLAGDIRVGAGLWAIYWGIPMIFLLPLIRFVAEGSEHRYLGDPLSIVDNTISHYGGWWAGFWYPLGDGYHFLHHNYCSIPTHKLKKAHKLLTRLDPTGYGACHLRRNKVLDQAWDSNDVRHRLA